MNASEDFWDSFRGGGSIVIECVCGRTHFGNGEGDFEDGEVERLRENAQKSPDKYIECQDEYVGYANIHDRIYVYDCPCGMARHIEDFVWDYRDEISAYLAKRISGTINQTIRDARVAAAVQLALDGLVTARHVARKLAGA